MAVLVPVERDGYIHFDEEAAKAAGAALAERYQSAEPFPHIVLDDFLPVDFLRGLLAEFPDSSGKSYFDRDQERLKFQYQPCDIPGRRMRNLITELNSPAILRFLQAMTGIKGLIADPYYMGGGLHETKSGGHLGVHADFNIHKLMNLERRLNLLVYLNDDWPESYGGQLELWDQKMERCRQSVLPVIGRAVVFNTSLDSFHGQPDPVRCPPDRSRRSIATYYYTAPQDGLKMLPERTTVFKARPDSGDKQDRRVQFDHFLRDWVPPRLYRYATKLNRYK
ncbi:MAG TPA: 2OG-Fe(II) oxygenase [Sphingobium sp.]|nr:2OG-Fe(II) oxygenase [Sphingobium sp.]